MGTRRWLGMRAAVVVAVGALSTMVLVADAGAATVTGQVLAGPLNVGHDAQVNATSCPAASFCVAGGSYATSNGTQGFISVFNGTTWVDTEVGASLDQGNTGAVTAVHCISTSFCMAVGVDTTAAGDPGVFASSFDGTSWVDTQVLTDDALGDAAYATSLSCTSASFCVAVGSTTADGLTEPFAAVFDGSTWTTSLVGADLNVGGGVGAFATLYSVSCTSPSFCAVGGTYSDANGLQALVATYNGTTWQSQELAADLNAGAFGGVDAVSCTSAQFCLAGGAYLDADGSQQALISTFNGSSWTDGAFAPELSSGMGGWVQSTSCVSSTFCAISGFVSTSKGSYPVVATDDAGTWTLTMLSKDLAGTYGGILQAISCTSRLACEAVGSVDTAVGSEALDATFNGVNWSDEVDAVPTATYSNFSTLSCPTAGLCVAGGQISTGSNGQAYVSSLALPVTTAPSAPGTPTITDQHGSYTLSWTPPASSGGAPVTYTVEEESSPNSWAPVATGLTNLSTTFTPTTAGVTYAFAIVATNVAGKSPWSPAAWLLAH